MPKPTPIEVQFIWETWRQTRPRPNLCRFTKDRDKLIKARLELGYSATDLVALVRYMTESNDSLPRWMRGANPRKKSYMDLDNLFRVGQLGKRVEAALIWIEELEKQSTPDASNPCGTELGPMGRFGRGS